MDSERNMSPPHHFIRMLAGIPVDPRIAVHSINAVTREGPVVGQTAGVVIYESAHIESVASDLAVRSAYSTPSHLETIEEGLVPAFLVEEHEDGSYTVFVPAVPTPTVGAVYILPRARVHPVDVPFGKAVKCVTRWGAGSGELLRAMRRD